MSFFNKLFGGDEKEKQPKVAEAPKTMANDIDQKRIKIEGAINQLDMKVQDFEDKERKLEHKIDILKAKAREMLEADKRREAKKYAEEATRISKQMESYSLRRKALQDKKNELEEAMMNMETIEVIGVAHEHIKDQEKYTDKLQDIILDSKQAKMHQAEINDKLKDLVDHDEQEEDVDDLLKELERDIKIEKKNKLGDQKQVGLNLPATNTNVNKAKKEEDDIAMMLADL